MLYNTNKIILSMKHFIALAALAMFFTSSAAYADWYPIHRTGTATLYGIEAYGESSFAVVGANGTILKSIDDGGDWDELDSPSTEDLHGISVGGGRWFAVGDGGTVLRSVDGGDTIELQSTPTTVDLKDVDMITMNIGTAVGENGVALVTANSGITWTSADTEQMSDLFGVWHVSTGTVWAVGEGGEIITSTNQGVDWSTRNSGTTEQLNDVLFLNSATGYAVGNNGTVIKTVNGGTAWTEVDVPTDGENLYSIDLFDETNLVIAGDGIIISSDDLGDTWSDELFSNDDPIFYDLASHEDGATWAVGEDADSGFIDFFDVVPPSVPGDIDVVGAPVVEDSTPTINWEASTDSTNDVDHYVVTIGDDSWETDNLTFTVPVALENGEYSVFVAAVDEAMNEGVAISTDFEIDVAIELPTGVQPESLVKLTCGATPAVNDPCHAVYYVDSQGSRHAFPNEKVFFTWFTDFDDVDEIDSDDMSDLPLGPNVTYRPGLKMVKFITVNTVYAVEGPNILRAIDDEDTAEDLYGSTWNQQIDDISDAFFSNYDFGEDINTASDYDKSEQLNDHEEIESIF